MVHFSKAVFLFLVVVGAVNGARRLRGNSRQGKNLLGTFPFNQQDNKVSSDHGDHHDHDTAHGEHHGDHHAASALESRVSRQDEGGAPNFGEVAEAGEKCIDKVEMVEETEYDDVIQCDHSYDRRCHTTYTTNYESQQEEDCEENFKKSCFIEYEKIAFNETAEVCRTPLVKDCDVQGPEICRTEYESECWTKQEVHDVEDDVVTCATEVEEKCEDETSGYTPITGCTKEPRELCAPAGCGFKEGAEECFEKTQTVVQDAPKEQCTLEPQRTCKHVTKLVPKLEPTEECVDVPKEVCTRSRTN